MKAYSQLFLVLKDNKKALYIHHVRECSEDVILCFFFGPRISVVRNLGSLRPGVVKTDLPMIKDIQCRYL